MIFNTIYITLTEVYIKMYVYNSNPILVEVCKGPRRDGDTLLKGSRFPSLGSLLSISRKVQEDF